MKQTGIILSLLFFCIIYGYFSLDLLYLDKLFVNSLNSVLLFKIIISGGTMLSYVIFHQFGSFKIKTGLQLLSIVGVNYLNSVLLTVFFDISQLLNYGFILILLTTLEILFILGFRYLKQK